MEIVETLQTKLSLNKSLEYAQMSKGKYYYQAVPESDLNLKLMSLIDKQYLRYPFYGVPRMTHYLTQKGYMINEKRIERLYKMMNIFSIAPGPHTSTPHPEHIKYPYLLRHLDITYPRQVYCTDITVIVMPKGYMYLTAVRDWYSKYVLSWELSNTMDVEFCLKSLGSALKYGAPEIFNTDQGSQYTSRIFTQTLLDNNIKISMDGVGRATDNICIERFWRDVKYECVYLYKPNTVVELYKQIKEYINFYNNERPHQTLFNAVPSDVFNKNISFQQRKKEAKKEINNINNNINLYNCSSSYS